MVEVNPTTIIGWGYYSDFKHLSISLTVTRCPTASKSNSLHADNFYPFSLQVHTADMFQCHQTYVHVNVVRRSNTKQYSHHTTQQISSMFHIQMRQKRVSTSCVSTPHITLTFILLLGRLDLSASMRFTTLSLS